MPEYVYALHDFLPENEDEVSFRAGERVEVVEKDDLYSDGWWQGRNLAGKVGLFPQSYTTPAPPPGSMDLKQVPPTPSIQITSPSQPLHDEPEFMLPINDVTPNGSINIHGRDTSADGEVMKATMTDVQKAIEQLGRRGNDRDASRSFSFASTNEGDLTDRETDLETDGEGDGEDWHKGARQKLAEKARKAAEEQEMRQIAEEDGILQRSVAPPIEVEMSDESEAEDDEHDRRLSDFHYSRSHPYIMEEDEDEGGPDPAFTRRISQQPPEDTSAGTIAPEDLETAAPDDPDPSTATRMSFPVPDVPSLPISESFAAPDLTLSPPPAPDTPPPLNNREPIATSVLARFPTPEPSNIPEKPSVSTVNIQAFPSTHHNLPSPQTSKHSSTASSTKVASSAQPSTDQDVNGRKSAKIPSEWSMEEVVEWLKSKGFDQDVCDKFTEQEITGDVLLALDVNLLKTEIGILAFGKRMRIANAITDLRRPPSIIYSDQPSPVAVMPFAQPAPYNHVRTLSFQSSSLNSPAWAGSNHPGSGAAFATTGFPDSPMAGSVSSKGGDGDDRRGGSNTSEFGIKTVTNLAGLGLATVGSLELMNGKGKPRPANLTLSPSDSNLGAKAISQISESLEEERATMSEGEMGHTLSLRQRLFRSSADSSPVSKDAKRGSKADSDRNSTRESSTPLSITVSPKRGSAQSDRDGSVASRHSRQKKSLDLGKPVDRISIFGSSFGGSIGKSRKPPPRYPSAIRDDVLPIEKTPSSMSLSRLYGSKKSSSKGEQSPKSPRESREKERDPKDHALLRKRSYKGNEAPASPTQVTEGSSLRQGQNILEQIGTPDHSGWMRKKGERYNSWKLRYFVLKGHHLYCLRSESKNETKIKGYINVLGYKVVADENLDPGRYAFKIVHDQDKTHIFSFDEQVVVREWMKAIMKSTITRNYSNPVVSSCNIPTIPLTVAQAMNPAPRPPSPTARDATQKALRRENPNQLSTRDAQILMGIPSSSGQVSEMSSERTKLDVFFSNDGVSNSDKSSRTSDSGSKTAGPMTPVSVNTPPPSRSHWRTNPSANESSVSNADQKLIEWANTHLPENLQITDPHGPLCGGLALLRLAESVKGRPSSPPVPDSAFPSGPHDDKLDGLFKLFDFLLDNDVKMGSVSINDVRQGKRDKIIQLMKALRAWEDKRRAMLNSIGQLSPGAGAFVAPVGRMWD